MCAFQVSKQFADKADVEPTGLLADVGCGDFGQEQTAATVGGYEGDGRGVGGVERHEACDTWDASVNVGYGPGECRSVSTEAPDPWAQVLPLGRGHQEITEKRETS